VSAQPVAAPYFLSASAADTQSSITRTILLRAATLAHRRTAVTVQGPINHNFSRPDI
jgi:hypothetical protein